MFNSTANHYFLIEQNFCSTMISAWQLFEAHAQAGPGAAAGMSTRLSNKQGKPCMLHTGVQANGQGRRVGGWSGVTVQTCTGKGRGSLQVGGAGVSRRYSGSGHWLGLTTAG